MVNRDGLAAAVGEADAGQCVLGLRQHGEWAAQHRGKGHVLPLVVEHRQQCEHVAHFH